MIGRIILNIIQFLDDVFKNIRCRSRCCKNECSCSNTDISIEEEVVHHQRQTTGDSHVTNRSHHSSIENDEGERDV